MRPLATALVTRLCGLALALTACGPGPLAEVPLPAADRVMFVAEIQPILDERCANPSCHGQPARPLEIYGVGQHRLDPKSLYLDQPLSDAEVELNFRRSRAFLMESDIATDCALIAKPLAEDAGGSYHAGGTQFEDAHDREYVALLEWVRSALGGPR